MIIYRKITIVDID